MSLIHDTPDGAAQTARTTKKMIKQLAAQLSGKRRGPDSGVRRESYDVDDRRARVFRPIGDGTVAGGLGWIDDLIQVAEEFDAWSRGQNGRGLLTPYGVTVLRWLCRLGNKIEFKTGRLDPPIAWLEKVTGFARRTVVDALARLRRHGFLDWIRRSRRTDNEGEAGPQREQVTNAYFFDITRLARRALQRFQDLRARRQRRRQNEPPPAPRPRASGAADPELAEALASLGQAVAERESSKPPVYPRQNKNISGRASRGAI